MEIKLVLEEKRDLWNSLVDSAEYSTIFHTWDWLKLVEKHAHMDSFGYQTRYKLIPLSVYDGNTPVGFFPFFYSRKALIGVVASPPLGVSDTLYLGPVFIPGKGFKPQITQEKYFEFVNTLDEYIKKEYNPQIITSSTPPGLLDSRPFHWRGYLITPRYTYSLELDRGEDYLWEGYNKVTRRHIRKASNIGITIREGAQDDYNKLIDMMKTRNRLNMSHEFSHSVFETLFPDKLRIFIAEAQGEMLSGLILLLHNKKVMAWVGTPRVDYEGITPNAAIYWESMKWAINNGYTKFEILGADDLVLFPWKRKFGAELLPYFNLRWQSKKITPFVGFRNLVRLLFT